MTRAPRFLASIAVACHLLCLSGTPVEAQQRLPNIVVILVDDMGYADVGFQGSRDIPTPNIDALARGGIRFTNAYVSSPECSQTRAGLMTGRYQQRFGHEFNLAPIQAKNHLGLPLSETTMATRLKAVGYRTALIGKWHLGVDEAHHPMARGFDEFFGFLGGIHTYVPAPLPDSLLDGKTPVPVVGYLTDQLAARAATFIRQQKSRPFFLYLAFNAVHEPMQATPKYLARVADIADERRRTYAAMLSAMDDGIGTTLAALHAEGLEENTLIFFLNDNGGQSAVNRTPSGASNVPLKDGKGTMFEGGIRVPFVIRWKGHLAEGKADARPIIQLDILPTALAAAGVPAKPEWHLDGVDLLPYLTGKSARQPHKALYWRAGRRMAIRLGDWKLITRHGDELGRSAGRTDYVALRAKLFNLADDIGETRDLAAAQPEKVKELADALERWNSELAAPLWTPDERPARGRQE